MHPHADPLSSAYAEPVPARSARWRQTFTIGLMAFLTVVDLFAAQAIIPSLTARYGVTPAAMGIAVNASTFGMAISGLLVALYSPRLDRRRGIVVSLLLLAIPTALLASAPDLATFAALRVWQGLLMAATFGLTLAYLGERLSAGDAADAFAAYITGNVASNLVGRFIAASITDYVGLEATFYCLALLNLLGAWVTYVAIERTPPMAAVRRAIGGHPLGRLRQHFANANLRAAFAIGFCILFAFIGTFTYVNFVLMRPPLHVTMMQIGFVYLVFLPSILTTGLAGRAVARFGARRTLWAALAVAGLGLPLLVLPSLAAVLAGMSLVAAGTFFAQAIATGYTSRAATSDRGAASGLYLSSYFLGGLVGAAALGRIFDTFGWTACVAGIGAALLAAALLALKLDETRSLSSAN